MAKVQEFYKGRKKRRNHAIIPFIILLFLVALIVVLFYGMQKYAVITKDGVSVELPILKDSSTVTVDSTGKEVRTFDQVSTEIVFESPDYSSVEAVAGRDVDGLRAIFVPYTDLNRDKLIEYSGRLVSGNALLLEMKPRMGQLMWESNSQMAVNYSLNVPTETTAAMPEMVAMLKEQGVYLAAQISCCVDEFLPTRTGAFCIHTSTGLSCRDEVGTWLDPYNVDLRVYVEEMVQELYDMGFDEVVLADVAHPVITDENTVLMYTREMSTPPSTTSAVCGFALGIANTFSDRDKDKALSIYVDTRPALMGPDPTNGQDARLFMKVYDRVFIRTDKYSYPYHVEDIADSTELGNIYDRLVPVVENYIPSDNTSWVLIDVEED